MLFTIVDDYKTEYGIDETSIGLVIGIGFLAGFVSQILFAPYADRGHARTVVVIGVFVSVAGLLLMAIGTSLVPILLGRIINGLGVGAASPAVRRIVIIADPTNLGTNLGRLLSADVFGFAMGPAISAILVGPFGIPAPFIVVSVVALVLLPFVARVPVDETSVENRPRKRLAFDLLAIRPFAGATVLAGVAFIMIGGFDALWSLVHDELGTSEWIANIGITLFALPLDLPRPPGRAIGADVRPVQTRGDRAVRRRRIHARLRAAPDRRADLRPRDVPRGERRHHHLGGGRRRGHGDPRRSSGRAPRACSARRRR